MSTLLPRLRERIGGMSRRDRRALLLGLVVLLPVFAWVGLVRPWWSQLTELREATELEVQLLERERSLLEDAPRLPAQREEADLMLRRREARLVQHANLALAEAAVARHVEGLAGESRALLLDVRTLQPPINAAASAGLAPIRLSVRLESDFEGLLGFLNALEAHPLLFRLIGLSLTPEEDPGVMRLEAVVEAYAAAPPQTEPGRTSGTGGEATERGNSMETGS